ncbi:unnamed protein product [Amoebophrya sp. A25]|nr:unnamed protein product [Amoebophrya sp. A25]|eukprot:GSA25T00018384001.1
MPGYPQGTAAEVLGNTGRLYNLAMVGSTLPFHSEEATKLEVPAILREREKNVKSTILGELCDVALIAGGGEGTAISLNAMARRKGTYVIPVPGTYAAGAVSEAIISENLKPQWAPAQLWANLGRAQASVEAVANLVVAVPKIAARDVRKQMHFSVKTTVCLVGGAASEAAGKFATKLVDNFPADGAIAFVSGGISGDAAEEAFHKAFLTANPAGRTYYLQTQGKAPASDDKSLDLTSKLGPAFGALEEDKVSREEKDIKSAILGELCDVMLVAGGGPGAIMSVKAAERRSAPVIPLPGTAGNGGYSDQLIAKGEKPQWAPAALWENGKQSVEGAVALVMNTPQMLAHTLRGNGQPFEGKTVLCMLGASKESPEGEESSILTKMGAAAKTVASTTQGMVMIVTGGLADDGVTLAVGKAFPNDDANYKGLVSLKSIEEKLGITDAEKGKQDEKDIKSAFLGQVCDVALVYKGGQGVWITLEAFGRRGGVPVIPMVGSGGAANVLAERPHPDWAPEELWKTEKNEEKLLNGAPPIYAHTIRSKMGATDKTIVCMAGSETGFPVVETRESVLASFVQGLRSTEGHDQKCAYLTGGMSGFPSEPFAKALPGSFALAPQTANLQAAPSEQAVNAITLPEGFKPEGTGNAKELQQEKDIKSAYLGAVCDVVVAAGGGKGTVITKEAMEMRGKAVIELTPGMTEDKARQLGGGLAEPTQPAET